MGGVFLGGQGSPPSIRLPQRTSSNRETATDKHGVKMRYQAQAHQVEHLPLPAACSHG
jgi:hypothetical protein